LCVHAKINGMGFLETPYRKVDSGKVDINAGIRFLSAEEEDISKNCSSKCSFKYKR
jgi:DNA-directed RNA polymerase subunit beta